MALLDDVKNYLDITWTDMETDKKIEGMIARGIKYIDKVAGTPQDYEAEDKAKELLFEYCLYARNQQLNLFTTDFMQELLFLQIHAEIKEYQEAQSEST